MKRIILLLVIISSFQLSGNAQESLPPPKHKAIGFVPQYMIMHGLRADFDYRLKKDKNNWLVFSPQVYLSYNSSFYREYDSLMGAGIEIHYRYYMNPKKFNPRGFYVSYGPLFQYFAVSDNRMHAETIDDNGVEYTVVRYGPVTTSIYKIGLTAQAGYLANAFNGFYMDFYTGAGIRVSFDNSGQGGLHKEYNDWYGDYGYSGTLLTIGVRIGLLY